MAIIERFVAVALSSVALACSGGDKIVSPDALNNIPGAKKLSSADSLYVADQISGAAFASIKALRNIVAPPLPGLFGNVPPAPCAPTTAGNTDSNGNGIPDDKTTTYTAANCSYSANGRTGVVTGTIRQQDLGGNYGYRVTYSNFNTVEKKGDSTFTTSTDGTIEYAFTSTTSARTQDGLTIVVGVAASTGSVSLSRAANLVGVFSPSGGNILSRTAALPTGTLSLSGTMTVIGAVSGNQIPAGGPSSQTISMTITTAAPLNANIGCSLDASINSGELQAAVGGSQTGTAAVTFRVCGQGGSPTSTPPGGGKK